MGLDNGIQLRVKGKINPESPLLKVPGVQGWDFCPMEEGNGYYNYDICYWRKCWNIRDMLFSCCSDSIGREDNQSYELSVPELRDIRDRIYNIICAGPLDWEDSIWTFDEMIPHLAWDLVRITALIDYVEHEGAGNAEVSFYDSY